MHSRAFETCPGSFKILSKNKDGYANNTRCFIAVEVAED